MNKIQDEKRLFPRKCMKKFIKLSAIIYSMIKNNEIREGIIECVIDLGSVNANEEMTEFDARWDEFFSSDKANGAILKRNGNTIKYPHKSWIPTKKDNRPSVLLLFGNSASHSVRDDIYFAYEGNGTEHRFWKVFRELGYIDISSNPKTMKQDFFNLNYKSPFRLGFEVIYTFPSSASKPKWSGVTGLGKLFGKKFLKLMFESEKTRLLPLIREFTKDGGAVIAIQKDAYNSMAQNNYSLKRAEKFELRSEIDNSIRVFGTPPTRRLYTIKMKEILRNIKEEILNNYPSEQLK
jgi:hypothetical protein